MTKNIPEQILEAYLSGSYFHYSKRCTLRISNEGLIISQYTPMGYITDLEDENGRYQSFMILTMQNFKSQPNWEKQKMQLAHAANKQDIMVLFVPMIDIFTGYENADEYSNKYGSNETSSSGNFYDLIFKDLIKVAKYSQDQDLKTAAIAYIDNDYVLHQTLLSYNQLLNGEFKHAEEVLCQYCQSMRSLPNCFITLLEPCIDCLKHMIDLGAEEIYFGQTHKAKWNTTEFIEYTNSIFNKSIKSYRNRPIAFKKIVNKKVEAFYKPKEVK